MIDKQRIKEELAEIGRELLAWSKPLDVLSDSEVREVVPRSIDRIAKRLLKILVEIVSSAPGKRDD